MQALRLVFPYKILCLINTFNTTTPPTDHKTDPNMGSCQTAPPTQKYVRPSLSTDWQTTVSRLPYHAGLVAASWATTEQFTGQTDFKFYWSTCNSTFTALSQGDPGLLRPVNHYGYIRATLCGWQDIKIQLLTNQPSQHIDRITLTTVTQHMPTAFVTKFAPPLTCTSLV